MKIEIYVLIIACVSSSTTNFVGSHLFITQKIVSECFSFETHVPLIVSPAFQKRSEMITPIYGETSVFHDDFCMVHITIILYKIFFKT